MAKKQDSEKRIPPATGDEITMKKRLLTIPETAAYLNLSERTLYNRVAPKAKDPFPVKAKRIGKLLRFDKRDLDDYIDSL